MPPSSSDLEPLRSDPTVGEACAERAWTLVRRVKSGPPSELPRRLAEARATFEALRPVLEEHARYEQKKHRRAESGTELKQIESALYWLERAAQIEDERDEDADEDEDRDGDRAVMESAPLPSPPVDPVERERQEIARARAPVDPLAALAAGPWNARFLRFVQSAWWEMAAVVALNGPAGRVNLWVWHPYEIAGATRLAQAEIVRNDRGLLLVSGGGRLSITGAVDVEPAPGDEADGVERSEPPARPDLPAWVALLDRMNQRARWDYEIEEWDDAPDGTPALVLRGRSGVYEPGCAIRFVGVSWMDLTKRFSHATFRLIDETERPAAPDAGGSVGVRIESDAGGFSARSNLVVARRLIFEDEGTWEAGSIEGEGSASALAPLVPLAHAFARRPDRADVRDALAYVIDRARSDARDPIGVALDAVGQTICWRGAEDALRALVGGDVPERADRWIAETLVGLLSERADLAPGVEGAERSAAAIARLAGPIAPAPERDAAIRAARAFLLDLLPSVTGAARERVEADLALLPDAPPSPRIEEDARMTAAAAVARQALGVTQVDIALDLAHVTVGRVLIDPAAEADLSEEERVVRAASLVALSDMRGDTPARLPDLVPDPVVRARFDRAEPIVRSMAPLVERLAEELCERGRLDTEEIALVLAGQHEALRYYRLLLAALLGAPFARAADDA